MQGFEPEWKPDGDILGALEGIDDSAASPTLVPTFTPRPQLVREPMFEENRAFLQHVRDSVEAIDFPTLDAARENGQQYAAALAASPGTRPLPVRVPGASLGSAPLFDAFASARDGADSQPAPVTEPETDSTWLLDFLGDLLDDAAEGAGRRITGPCPKCAEIEGFCEDCQDALARCARYCRLAERIEGAPDDRDAVLALMAGAWRQGAGEAESAAEVPA